MFNCDHHPVYLVLIRPGIAVGIYPMPVTTISVRNINRALLLYLRERYSFVSLFKLATVLRTEAEGEPDEEEKIKEEMATVDKMEAVAERKAEFV
jgi:hypothetical protein